MARSISIDPLALHNISICEDHFVICHDSTKSDKEGEKVHNKSVYCSPLDPILCPGVSLGIWLSLNQNTFRDNSEQIFIHRGARVGSAAHRYCEQLLIIMKASWGIVQVHNHYVRTWYKERSATHVSCATTALPPIASLANRDDWSMGKVLDVYWQFADVGDAYLGQCLCGLDPTLSTFSVLPPNWTVDDPVNDPDIDDALQLMYGVIIVGQHPNSIRVLLCVLASVTYASDWLLTTSGRYPGHPMSAVPLHQNPELLIRLKTKITIEPSNLLSTATGIPPHVMQRNMMTALLELCQTTLLRVNEHATVVRETFLRLWS
jgi:hypothetical protein